MLSTNRRLPAAAPRYSSNFFALAWERRDPATRRRAEHCPSTTSRAPDPKQDLLEVGPVQDLPPAELPPPPHQAGTERERVGGSGPEHGVGRGLRAAGTGDRGHPPQREKNSAAPSRRRPAAHSRASRERERKKEASRFLRPLWENSCRREAERARRSFGLGGWGRQRNNRDPITCCWPCDPPSPKHVCPSQLFAVSPEMAALSLCCVLRGELEKRPEKAGFSFRSYVAVDELFQVLLLAARRDRLRCLQSIRLDLLQGRFPFFHLFGERAGPGQVPPQREIQREQEEQRLTKVIHLYGNRQCMLLAQGPPLLLEAWCRAPSAASSLEGACRHQGAPGPSSPFLGGGVRTLGPSDTNSVDRGGGVGLRCGR